MLIIFYEHTSYVFEATKHLTVALPFQFSPSSIPLKFGLLTYMVFVLSIASKADPPIEVIVDGMVTLIPLNLLN